MKFITRVDSKRKALKTLVEALGILGFLVLLWAAIDIPRWQAHRVTQDPEKYFEVENKARSTLFQGLGGAFFFVTAYLTWRNLQVTEDNRRIAEDNHRIAEEKQVAERFTKAVEMLSASQSIEIQLGGIHSLAQVSRNSPDYYWTVLQILTSFVRLKSPKQFHSKSDNPFPENIQAALDVIGLEQVPIDKKINLGRTDLSNALFGEAKLARANFELTNIDRVEFNSSDLSEADFGGAVGSAKFSHTNLKKAKFINADLKSSVFFASDLERTNFYRANLEEATFQDSDLREAEFVLANLYRADFRKAKNITLEQIKVAENWEQGLYSLDFAEQLGLCKKEQSERASEKQKNLFTLFDPKFMKFMQGDSEIQHEQKQGPH